MNSFRLSLFDSAGADRFERVRQFIGADGSGAFGILAGHEPMVVALRYGLARFQDDADLWRYVALPGGILRFKDNALSVATVRYFLGDEPTSLVAQLENEMARDDSELSAARQTMAKIDHSLMRRLADLEGRGGLSAEHFPGE
jgi:F-type H+-transporting ATPase subunit epsilon